MTRQWELGEVCEHGLLGRKCDICSLNDDVRDLLAVCRELLAAYRDTRANPRGIDPIEAKAVAVIADMTGEIV